MLDIANFLLYIYVSPFRWHKSSHVLLCDTICDVWGLHLVRRSMRANSPTKVEDFAGSVTWSFSQTLSVSQT